MLRGTTAHLRRRRVAGRARPPPGRGPDHRSTGRTRCRRHRSARRPSRRGARRRSTARRCPPRRGHRRRPRRTARWPLARGSRLGRDGAVRPGRRPTARPVTGDEPCGRLQSLTHPTAGRSWSAPSPRCTCPARRASTPTRDAVSRTSSPDTPRGGASRTRHLRAPLGANELISEVGHAGRVDRCPEVSGFATRRPPSLRSFGDWQGNTARPVRTTVDHQPSCLGCLPFI